MFNETNNSNLQLQITATVSWKTRKKFTSEKSQAEPVVFTNIYIMFTSITLIKW